MAKMEAFRSSTSRRFYSSMSCSVPASTTPVTNTYHWSNQGKITTEVSLKRMLIKGPVTTPYTIVQHSFRLTFRKRRMLSSLLLFILRALDLLILLASPHDYICAFLIVWKSYQFKLPSYFNNRNTSFVVNFKPALSWADWYPVAWTVRNLWRILA